MNATPSPTTPSTPSTPHHRLEGTQPETNDPASTTVHVAIGNSDNRLTQYRWAEFVGAVDLEVRRLGDPIYGFWVSPSSSQYQNAAWAFQLDPRLYPEMRAVLATLAGEFDQESIAWNESETEFIRPDGTSEPLLP